MLFYGPLGRCPICNGNLECTGNDYTCSSFYSEWSSCTYSTREPPRREERLVLPNGIDDPKVIQVHLFLLSISYLFLLRVNSVLWEVECGSDNLLVLVLLVV